MFKRLTKKLNIEIKTWLIFGLGLIIFISLSVAVVVGGRTDWLLSKKLAATREAARPADLELITIIDANCQQCAGLTPIIDLIKKENIKTKSERNIDSASPEAKALISQYQIDKIPALIVKGELNKSEGLKNLWTKIGEIKNSDTFILRNVSAPYLLVSSGEIKGLIELILIADKRCQTCYDVTEHEQILPRFGILTDNSQVVDATLPDGLKLVDKYKIKLLPTFILKGDVEAYPALKSIWSQVGTVESDGTYVFREGVKQMGVYYNLITNTAVQPATAVQPPPPANAAPAQ